MSRPERLRLQAFKNVQERKAKQREMEIKIARELAEMMLSDDQ
ncbi:hypothetical protein [Winogradskyella thalassocola]|nr:hypothetical protein [Winogradskyella thalassocola]